VPGSWTPHVTLGYRHTAAQLALAADLVLARLTLVLTGWAVEVEDGATGDVWALD
jgi:hypothetical protein